MLIIFIIILIFIQCTDKNKNKNYMYVVSVVQSKLDSADKWNYIIYLDINSCLDCTEDIESWVKLEKEIPEHGGLFSIWTNKKDSTDVAVGLALEGLESNVYVLEDDLIKILMNFSNVTPIKIISNINDESLKLVSSFTSKLSAKEYYNNFLISLEKN